MYAQCLDSSPHPIYECSNYRDVQMAGTDVCPAQLGDQWLQHSEGQGVKHIPALDWSDDGYYIVIGEETGGGSTKKISLRNAGGDCPPALFSI